MSEKPEQQIIQVEILRYSPETDQEPVWQSYPVPFDSSTSVLEGLTYIKDHLDGSLSFRWSCRMAVCGSCGMQINGEPKLACHTFLREFYPHKVRIEALANFPIERDLVVVMDDFIEKLETIKPYVIREEEKPLEEGEYLQTPAEQVPYMQYSQCINCMLCYAACPQYALNEAFIGPAALALTHRYNMDNRDQGVDQRMEVLNMEEGVWGCTAVGACSEVCPKGVHPAAAIQQSKILGTLDYMKMNALRKFILPRGAK